MKQSKVRLATVDDISFISEISKALVSSDWDEKQITYEIKENPFSFVLVITLDDEIVGFLDYWITFDSSTVAEIGVKEEYQHSGYGEMLMKAMFDDLRKNNVIFSSLEVREGNIKAINFYKKLGYKIETIKEHYYQDKENALYMLKGMVE